MRMHLLLIPALLLLGACQTTQLDRDFDPSRDFSTFRSWSWQEPAVQYRPDDPRLKSDLTEQRLRAAIGEQLDQHGLRAAPAGSVGDLKVQAWLIVDQRQNQVTTHYGGFWGSPWHGHWGGPGYSETRVTDYQTGTLQIDLYNGKDGQLVWRGSGRQILRDNQQSPSERSAQIRETVAKVLSQYPPR